MNNLLLARFSQPQDIAGSISDYDRAWELDPNEAHYFGDRGKARQAKGDFRGAVEDYGKAIALAKDEAAYPCFYRTLCLRRLHEEEPTDDLARVASQWKPDWTQAIGRFVSGGIDGKDFLTAAERGDAGMIAGQQCEADYFIGMAHLMSNEPALAHASYEKCVGASLPGMVETSLARVELARMDSVSPGK